MKRLQGKAIVIAGGGSGIGAGTATRLATEGASLVIGDLRPENAARVADQVRADGGSAIPCGFDLRDEESVAALINTAVEEFGGLDGVHINSANFEASRSDLDAVTVDLAVFDDVLAVNLRGHLLCTRYAIPHLIARGGGALVYTSSAAAFIGEPKRVSYAVSKAGLNALMRHVASRWGKERIRANAIAPGLILTDGVQSFRADRLESALKGTRSHRLGEPADVAAMVALLMSDDGAWINGQVISVDGGATIR